MKCTVANLKRCFFVRITNYKSYQEQLDEVNWTNYLLTKV